MYSKIWNVKCEPDFSPPCWLQPLVKTALKASTSQRTLKPSSISGQKKSESTAAMSTHDEFTVSVSHPENGLVIVSDDANQGLRPPNGESNLEIDLSEFIPTKKSSRRKSYTTSLLEGSKVDAQHIKTTFPS